MTFLKNIIRACLINLFVCSLSYAAILSTPLDKLDYLYDQRDQPGKLMLCINELNDALASTPAENTDLRYNILWRIARTASQVPVYVEASKKTRLTLIEAGMQAADQAHALQPNAITPIYWKAIAVGRHAELKGIMKSLRSIKPIRDSMLTILNKDPSYHRAYFVLSRLYRKAPKRISIGNPQTALNYINQALELDPNDSLYLLEKARVLKKLKQKKAAKEVITLLLSLPEDDPIYFSDQVRRDKLAGQDLF